MNDNNQEIPSLKAFRASIFHFLKDPALTQAGEGSYQYWEDGLLVVEKGLVKEVGAACELLKKYQPCLQEKDIYDFRGKIILPGFIDTHVHYPQMEMIGAFGEELLEWLKKYTFPTEARYKDKAYAHQMARSFLQELLKNGTTTALIFSTVHRESVEAIFEEAERINIRIISGKVLMDRNAPAYLTDTPESAYQESKELIEIWHNKRGRIQYAITPRFAPTSTPEQLAAAGKLRQEFPDVYMQTHVAENRNEVEWVKSLFPQSESYLKVYHDFKLTGPRSVFAHGIYLDESDFQLIHQCDSAISFCPSSNLFLGSGLFNLKRAEETKIRLGLGTDVGGGTSLSLLQAMNDAYKVVQLNKAVNLRPLSPLKAFYLATLGGARALHLDDKIGNFLPGHEADFIVIDPKATPLLQMRMEKVSTLEERLFALQILGDDRCISAAFLMGEEFIFPF